MAGCMQAVGAGTTALDDYVARPDPSYDYSYLETRNREGYSVHVVTMNSLRWRSPDEVDRTLWVHEFLIAVPWVFHSGNENSAILIVNGGTNQAPPTTENDPLLGLLAQVTGSVVAMVSQIPNQRLTFADEEDSRIEDEILAYGMDKYLDTGDPEWLAHLPMTKAVIRALDTLQSFPGRFGDVRPRVPGVEEVIIVGGSKRGWTTWLAAAVEANNSGWCGKSHLRPNPAGPRC